MKTRRNPFLVLALGITSLSSIHASVLTWDTVSDDSNLTGGTGSWDTASPGWSTDAGLTNITWPETSTGDDDALFSGTGGLVTILEPGITANNVTFSSASYILSGAKLSLDSIDPDGVGPLLPPHQASPRVQLLTLSPLRSVQTSTHLTGSPRAAAARSPWAATFPELSGTSPSKAQSPVRSTTTPESNSSQESQHQGSQVSTSRTTVSSPLQTYRLNPAQPSLLTEVAETKPHKVRSGERAVTAPSRVQSPSTTPMSASEILAPPQPSAARSLR